VLIPVLALTLMAGFFGLVLGYSAVRFRLERDPVVDQIEDLLPQTQCGQCGYAGCRPYAEAVAAGEAEIDLCVPGGANTVAALADLLGRDHRPAAGEEVAARGRQVAVIDEAWCVGCTVCIQACPVDAIVGAAKHMHTVIRSECTGCELCVEPCPVECIHMEPVGEDLRSWRWPYPKPAREAA
jgi:electron transport complex protein RnfB